MAKDMPRFYVINEPTILRIIPALAIEIGFNESIVLLQLEFLISISNTEMKNGKYWTYQSIRNLQKEYFPFWSVATINRTINSLKKQGLIYVGNFNKNKYDKTQWFSINYEKCAKLHSIGLGNSKRVYQNETPLYQNDTWSNQNDTTIPETPTDKLNTTTAVENFSKAYCDYFHKEPSMNSSEMEKIEAMITDEVSISEFTQAICEMENKGYACPAISSAYTWILNNRNSKKHIKAKTKSKNIPDLMLNKSYAIEFYEDGYLESQ